jgi:prolyl 4-hydroxylase
MEILLRDPFRMIFHGILSEKEISFLIDYARPKLSRERGDSPNNIQRTKYVTDNVVKTIHKTAQCWIKDKEFTEPDFWDPDEMELLAMKNPQQNQVLNPILDRLTKKLEIATRMSVGGRWSSTDYQVTNYGLGGLCETHIDPLGYLDGTKLFWHDRRHKVTGDLIATFMAWLGDVADGGATAFECVDYEQTVQPTRGSAAFWFNLNRRGHRDGKTTHGGCPVLRGSKWTLNKWIYSFDQFLNYPCGLHKNDRIFGFQKRYKSQFILIDELYCDTLKYL